MGIWLDWLAANWPMLFGVVVSSWFFWRVSHRVLEHIEHTQAAAREESQGFAKRLDEAEGRCVEQMSRITDSLRPVLERNSDAFTKTMVALDRHEKFAERWSIASSNRGKGEKMERIPLENPNNEPVYGIPPGEREPEVMYRDANALEEKRDWGHTALGIADLHAAGITGEGVVVAILDTGVDTGHPGLSGQVVASSNHTNSPTASDRQGHGTHCAGIVAERADGAGLVGVAPGSKIHSGKVLGDNGSGLSSGIAQGIRTATAARVDIISMSLGGPAPDAATRDAITAAVDAGIWVACAAGNEGPSEGPSFPGNYPNVVCVAASDEQGNVARFSTRNRQVDIAAPGVSILSTYPGGRYASLSGTSMATPYVAGVLALLRGEIKKRGLTMPTLAKVMDIMSKTAKDITPTGRDTASGAGLIQPKALIQAVLADLQGGGTSPPPVSPPPAGGKTIRLTHPELVAAGVPSLTVELRQASTLPNAEGLIPLPLGLRAALRMLLPILERVAKRTGTQIDDILVKLVEILFGMSATNVNGMSTEADWWKAAQEILRQLLPFLKQIAARTDNKVDDFIIDIVERLLASRTSVAAMSSAELHEKARKYATEARLLSTAA